MGMKFVRTGTYEYKLWGTCTKFYFVKVEEAMQFSQCL